MDKKIYSLAKEWYEYANKDLLAAEKLYKEINHITCFHCQQAAEKYIKGLLVQKQTNFKKSHHLSYLLDLLDLQIPEEIMLAAEYLNEYAVETRYPGDFSEISNDETTKAIEYAKAIKKYILCLANES